MARKTVEDLRNLVKSVRDRSFPYEKERKRRGTGMITIGHR